jgi:tryptophan synthase beta chain
MSQQRGRWDADEHGYFGDPEHGWGGRFMPEALVAALDELDAAWQEARADPTFQRDFDAILRDFANTPSPLYHAERLSRQLGVTLLLKREDLNHTGAHKIRNVLGQALLTRRMGKPRVIAETGAGQHGVAAATAAAYFGLDCTVYMGEVDTRRQALNVARMKLLGSEVVPVSSGSATLKDAINEALRDWVASVDHTAYLFGTAAGPHPFPSMVRDLCRGIGDEARQQCLDRFGRVPDTVAACVGGGSNAIGLFTAFLDDPGVAILGLEPAGDGVETGRHAATISAGAAGVLHGARTFVLQDDDGQTVESHSISAGLDYPGVGPQHAHLAATGRATYVPVTDAEAMDAMALLSRTEGIIPAIESAHALAGAIGVAKRLADEKGPEAILLVNLSGRGDKDMETAIDWFGLDARERGHREPVGDGDDAVELREASQRSLDPESATEEPIG